MKGNVWGPKQRIPVEEAIRVGTLNGAYDSYEFFLNGPTHADIYTLSLHDALPISQRRLVPPRPDHERRRRPRTGCRGTVTAARIGDRDVRLTHLDRVVWPATGTTKGALLEYLLAIAPVLLPHLRRRPTMLWRFPEGVEGPGWFQAQCRSRPSWVETHTVRGARGELLEYCLIEEPATLAWLANLGTIELHPHGWTIDRPSTPIAIVFDLDPGPPAGLVEAARVALAIRDRLRAARLDPVV